MTSNEEKIVKLAFQILLDGYIKSLTMNEIRTPVIVAMFELKSLLTDDDFMAAVEAVGGPEAAKVFGGDHA